MKTLITQSKKLNGVLLVVMALFVSLNIKAQTYTTIANGAWTSSSTWSGGNVPPTNGTITSGMVINIKHMVTYSSSSISNSGTINISNPGGIAPGLQVASGINITNNSTGVINVTGAELRQYRFSGGGESGTAQTGSFTNNGGKVYITNSFVEIAQNWTNQSGGKVVFNNSSMEIGQAYNLYNSSTDSISTTSISVGMQGSGNFSVSGSSANAYYDSLRVEVASTSGSFTLQGGTINGSIDFITLKNHVTGTSSIGQITAANGIHTSGITLNSYCVPLPTSYVPNGNFSGSQTENCSLSYFPAALMSSTSAVKLNYSTDPTLKSGTALKVGAVYRYENVKPGMDAVVTIDSLVNGIVINTIDDNTGQNGGYLEAFQPIMTSGSSTGYSYAVFTFNFVVTGTSTALTVDTADVTALDIDGANNLYEFDQINMGHGATAGYLSYSPAISLTQTGPGTFMGIDVDGVSQPGVDTSSRGNMFTTTNYNVNSFMAKLGMKTTKSQQTQRLFSLYTSSFSYPVYSVLPVTLESFTATLENSNNQVNVDWTVGEQTNVSHYVVERSIDGANFTDAGIVFSNENSSQTSAYSFPDDINGIQQSLIYYRLCTVGVDGSVKYSDIRVVRISKESDNAIAVLTYPNPVVSQLNVTIPSSWQNKKVSYELYNTSGQLSARIDEGNGSQTETINVNNLTAGLYIVRVSCEGQTALQKIIKY
jgi:Secretion system C-terminal sorting domain